MDAFEVCCRISESENSRHQRRQHGPHTPGLGIFVSWYIERIPKTDPHREPLARIRSKDPNATIKTRNYACPRKWKEAWHNLTAATPQLRPNQTPGRTCRFWGIHHTQSRPHRNSTALKAAVVFLEVGAFLSRETRRVRGGRRGTPDAWGRGSRGDAIVGRGVRSLHRAHAVCYLLVYTLLCA